MLNRWVCAGVMVLALAIPVGAQNGPLIADLIGYEDVRAVIPATTAETFARVAGADADQRSAAITLVNGARTELGRIINRHLRAVRDDPTLDQMKQSEASVVRLAREVERQLMEDLRAVLGPDQEDRFEAFERAHRRSLLTRALPQAMPVDLWAFFSEKGFDPSTDEGVASLLGAFDRESDVALVRQRRALRAYNENVRQGFDGTDESQARNRAAQDELIASNANLERVSASVVEPMISALPPDVADELVTRIIEVSTREYDRNVSNPERYPVVREVLALGLAPEQRRRVRAIVDVARVEARDDARATVVEQARYVMLPDAVRTDGRTSPLNLYLGKASDRRKRVSAEVLGVLTPEQRLEYDASDVVEPSTSSVVKDE